MGHFYETIRGEGATRAEAQSDAIDRFLCEEGTQHSVRGVSKARFLGKVPPRGVIYRDKRGNEVHDYTRRNEAAPPEAWLEQWEFELHTHA
jgi:hypothetical protein